MTLTGEQMELLHAWVDGETTTTEGEAAQLLVKRDEDARLYVAELERLKKLLLTHGCVSAPEGLRERVCTALKSEFAAPVIKLPRAPWRLAIAAAAAAVVVSIALINGPWGGTSDDSTGEDIAEHSASATEPRSQAGPGTEPFGKSDDGRNDFKKTDSWSKVDDPDASTGPVTGNFLPPKPPAEAPLDKENPQPNPDGGATTSGLASASVLSLDRGVDQPFELSVNMNRSREASVLQVYNDVLIVSSMYGAARISDSEPAVEERHLGAAANEAEEDFYGTDFTSYDGVEVELDAEQVPQLLAALNRLTAEQRYGEVIVPADLRKSIDTTTETVDELQDISRELEELARKSAPPREAGAIPDGPGGVRGYLPPDVQRECVTRDADKLPERDKQSKLGDRLERVTLAGPEKRAEEDMLKDAERAHGERRKVKLVIRLR